MGIHLKTQCDEKYIVAFYIINYKQKCWQQVKKSYSTITISYNNELCFKFCWTKKPNEKNSLIEYNKL